MSEEKRHIVYTATDIQKYLSGQMSNTEMHAIEKAAMDDPLLAEAIEGYEGMEQKNWSKELASLKEKLITKESKPLAPVYPLRKWWRTAAAVIVIGSGIAITYLFSNKTNNKVSSIANVKTIDSLTVKSDSVNIGSDIAINETAKINEIQLPSGASESINPKQIFPRAEEAKKDKEYDSSFLYKPSAAPANNNKDIAAAGSTNDDLTEKKSEPVSLSNEATSNQLNEVTVSKVLPSENRANYNQQGFINAQVITADNKPVAFANVSIQKDKQTLYTDSKGIFKLPAKDSLTNIVVTSAGYIPKKFTFKNSTSDNKIVLQEDTVGITAISSNRSKSLSKPELKKEIENAEIDEDAVPSVGWDDYNNYLNNNLILPNDAREKNIHGVVEVFVKLKNNGDISEVKVNKPLCAGCDAEALRLVKEGPKWDVKNKKAKKAKVKITF
jgi:hypothetical protein